jgi:hypothetical protein
MASTGVRAYSGGIRACLQWGPGALPGQGQGQGRSPPEADGISEFEMVILSVK